MLFQTVEEIEEFFSTIDKDDFEFKIPQDAELWRAVMSAVQRHKVAVAYTSDEEHYIFLPCHKAPLKHYPLMRGRWITFRPNDLLSRGIHLATLEPDGKPHGVDIELLADKSRDEIWPCFIWFSCVVPEDQANAGSNLLYVQLHSNTFPACLAIMIPPDAVTNDGIFEARKDDFERLTECES